MTAISDTASRSQEPTVVARLAGHRQVGTLKAADVYWPDVAYRSVQRGDGRMVTVNGRECLMFASNDYLGLRWDPRVVEAGTRAVHEFGVGAGSSRLVAGSVTLHELLEEELADWLGRERVLVFTTGYQANVGALSALLGRHDIALCDRGVHASLVDGCRLAGARVRRFDRRDPQTLERSIDLHGPKPGVGVLVVTDGVYSMDGDTLPLDDLVRALGPRDDVCFLVDEAHALAVVGPAGAGVAGSSPAGPRVDVVTGNLSKALSSCGGYVAGSSALIDGLRATSRSLIFSTAGPPTSIAVALTALRIARAEPERRARAHAVADRLRRGLAELGLSTGRSDSLIVPAVVGDELRAVMLTQRLMELGICVGYAVHPAVPLDAAILRFSVTAALSVDDADRAIDALSQAIDEHRAVPTTESLVGEGS
jgi:8-amino-7-oxononanoate synthase